MIKHSKILLLLVSSLTFFGCYTVAWQPGEDLPANDNLKQNQSNFYNAEDFGVFSYYYNSVWWLNPDYEFLNNIAAKNNLDDNNDSSGILDIGPIIIAPLPAPTAPPAIILPSPIKIKNKSSVESSKPTKRIRSNRNKIRNNNGERKNRKGRHR